MIVAAHQPNFLPNSRFWWKLATSDIMDLRYRAQYTERGYQRRVKMRDAWFSMPLDGKFKTEPINQVRIKTDEAKDAFRKMMHGRYSGSAHYKTRGLDLVEFAITLEYRVPVGVEPGAAALRSRPVGNRHPIRSRSGHHR